jgi:hypothetical protein
VAADELTDHPRIEGQEVVLLDQARGVARHAPVAVEATPGGLDAVGDDVAARDPE